MNYIVKHHKDQLTKFAKFISRDSKLFTMATRSYLLLEMSLYTKSTLAIEVFKVVATDMRSFARSKFFGSLIHKNNFGLIW